MFKGAADGWRLATVALLIIMCLLASGMLFGLVLYGGIATGNVVMWFSLVAASAFIYTAVVAILLSKRWRPVMLFGLTALALIAFVGAVDFANGRFPFDWVASWLS